ncbi:mechanosensitive ion channel family protein [Neptunomonas antarctica]|uniref:Mechanosensitive ion channel n=1 Tax=Neptunomonas antarctica TaxID=619304 RepID=A0A1N7LMS0_9GAMM|nr:mechanosensitive ion channel family protein [Neptunomonas antarctica]SIS75116.1 Mechanosensitive ion channel [Neptunomonas antarctica]
MIEFDIFKVLVDHKLLSSLTFIVLAYLLKLMFVKVIRRRSKAKGEDGRSLINLIKNLINLTVIVLFFVLWSDELQKFALSVAAFVVAIVIATREFIQCIIGYIYIIASRPFQVGDWIQVGSNYGEVTETNWAKLTLLEVDIDSYSHTGKTLYLPNSLLILNTIKNLNFMKRYATHTFTLTRNQRVNLFLFRDELLERAALHCQDFYEVAHRYNSLIEKRLDVTIAGPAPTVTISTSDIGKNTASVTIFCPSDQALDIEQKITQDFMELWYSELKKSEQVAS